MCARLRLWRRRINRRDAMGHCMALKVIGAGFGRTGTFSLRTALEQLGFAPCYHMVEVFQHPEHNALWEDGANGKPVNWNAFLAPYQAAVDWPVCHFWRELSQAFPGAKVILTERDAEKWWQSISQTILTYMSMSGEPADPVRKLQSHMGKLIVGEKTFGNNFEKHHVLEIYRRHNAAVKAALPASRLLVFDTPQGWEPLCNFLGVPVPDAPFPKTNSTVEFRARIGLAS